MKLWDDEVPPSKDDVWQTLLGLAAVLGFFQLVFGDIYFVGHTPSAWDVPLAFLYCGVSMYSIQRFGLGRTVAVGIIVVILMQLVQWYAASHLTQPTVQQGEAGVSDRLNYMPEDLTKRIPHITPTHTRSRVLNYAKVEGWSVDVISTLNVSSCVASKFYGDAVIAVNEQGEGSDPAFRNMVLVGVDFGSFVSDDAPTAVTMGGNHRLRTTSYKPTPDSPISISLPTADWLSDWMTDSVHVRVEVNQRYAEFTLDGVDAMKAALTRCRGDRQAGTI